MSDVAWVVAVGLLAGGLLWWTRPVPESPRVPTPITVSVPAPVAPAFPAFAPIPGGAGVWMVLMDADERELIASEYVPVHRRPFKARYEGVEYLVARGSVDEGYFIYRRAGGVHAAH